MDIHSLGYVGVEGPNQSSWSAFAEDICGLQPASMDDTTTDEEGLFFKMDDRRWRLGVYSAEVPGLRYAGYEVADRRSLENSVRELQESGVSVIEGKAEECATRGVRQMAHFQDPAGFRIEIFHTASSDTPVAPSIGASRFVTGRLGMGHIAVLVPDIDACLDFYIGVMGFQESDYFEIGPGMSMHFLRCNARHHSLAVGRVGDFSALHHVLFEVQQTDQVGISLDRARAASVPISTEIGRHANDMMFSFYMKSPSGFDVEIGCEGRLVEPGWVSAKLDQADIWGHAGLDAGMGESP